MGIDDISPRDIVRLAADLSWKRWDDEVVIHDDATGNTHLLAPDAAEILACLEAAGGACPRADLARRVSLRLDVATVEETEFATWIAEILSDFKAMDLIDLEPAR